MTLQTAFTTRPTQDRKVNGVSNLPNFFATYRPVGPTCPQSCPFLQECYAIEGRVNLAQNNASYRNDNLVDCIAAVRDKHGSGIIRHLVSGDVFIDNAPDFNYIGHMCEAHLKSPTVLGYGYTHGWESIPSHVFKLMTNNLVMNASCETHDQVVKALDSGWACVKVVPEDTPRIVRYPEYTQVVCPAQIKVNGKQVKDCASCKLCMMQDRKSHGVPLVVAFRTHGTTHRVRNRVNAAISAAA